MLFLNFPSPSIFFFFTRTKTSNKHLIQTKKIVIQLESRPSWSRRLTRSTRGWCRKIPLQKPTITFAKLFIAEIVVLDIKSREHHHVATNKIQYAEHLIWEWENGKRKNIKNNYALILVSYVQDRTTRSKRQPFLTVFKVTSHESRKCPCQPKNEVPRVLNFNVKYRDMKGQGVYKLNDYNIESS